MLCYHYDVIMERCHNKTNLFLERLRGDRDRGDRDLDRLRV